MPRLSGSIVLSVGFLLCTHSDIFPAGTDQAATEPLRDHPELHVLHVELDDLTVDVDRTRPVQKALLPESILALEGQRIRIHGIVSAYRDERNKVWATFFGETRRKPDRQQQGLIESFIPVRPREPEALLQQQQTAVVLEGILRIEPVTVQGRLRTLYRIDDATVRPTKPREGFFRLRLFGC